MNNHLEFHFQLDNDDDSESLITKTVSVNMESSSMKFCIIHHIARCILINKINQNTNIKKILEEKKVLICFLNNRESNGLSNNNTIQLGVILLEELFSLCADMFNGNSELVYLFPTAQLESHSCVTFGVQDNSEERIFSHIISCGGNPESFDSIDMHKVYRVFSDGLWFIFLHELGHIYHGHKAVEDISIIREQEKKADAFAVKNIRSNNTRDNKNIQLGILAVMGTIFIHEEQNSTHPSAISRLIAALKDDAFACYYDDEIWNISYDLLKYLSKQNSKGICFKDRENQTYKQMLENIEIGMNN